MSWRLRVRDKFQAAHFLKEYQGKCEKIHGHTFQVEAVFEAKELDRTGIGIDFALIKAKLAEVLPDHTLLNEVYPFNPSAENLARELYNRLKQHLPVIEVTVWESEDACASYSEDH
jgi:6-pyruvoyltetrahydropterin/6-carboxytetrahydropterin synthase